MQLVAMHPLYAEGGRGLCVVLKLRRYLQVGRSFSLYFYLTLVSDRSLQRLGKTPPDNQPELLLKTEMHSQAGMLMLF